MATDFTLPETLPEGWGSFNPELPQAPDGELEDKPKWKDHLSSLYLSRPVLGMYAPNLDTKKVDPLLPTWRVLNTSLEPEDSVQFVHCILNEGDTRVFVDAPNTIIDPRRRTNCVGVVPSSQTFLVHSEKLFALKDSKFAQMLDNEIYQARVKRRRKPDEDLMKGVKYLLDLTPPSEGDDLVFQMTELSLTPGIVKWWSADLLHGISASLVKGHDDMCSCRQDPTSPKSPREAPRPNTSAIVGSPSQTQGEESSAADAANATAIKDLVAEVINSENNQETEHINWPPSAEEMLRVRARGHNEICKTPPHFQIPDYCPFRHYNSIIRLLLMIEGKSVNFNSAARVWTMVGIAKIFECTSVIQGQVTQWIMSNTRFIEVLPEEALNIGFTLQLPQVTQAAFKILVNELALDEAADSKDTRNRKVTVFGRRRGDAGDEMNNLIQHAARALIERTTSDMAQLQNPNLFDYTESSIWGKLRQIEIVLMAEDDGTFGDALGALRQFIDALVYQVNSKVEEHVKSAGYSRDPYPEMDKDRATYVEPREFDQIQYIVPGLNNAQKLLLPFVYNELGRVISQPLFFGQRAKSSPVYMEHFAHIMEHLEDKLQVLIDKDPSRGSKDAWQILFSSDSPIPHKKCKYGWDGEGRDIQRPLIPLDDFEVDVKYMLRPIVNQWERHDQADPPLNITRHLLLNLTNNELKFLPLWAGGNDDGTGGVFENFLPPAEMGPSGPGPAYHTGLTVPSAPPSLSGSLMEDIRDMNIRGSTTNGSIDVHDSVSTVYRPDKVIAADSSVDSESFTDNDSDYARAKFQVPAEHQDMGQAVDMLVGTASDGSDDDDALSDTTEIGPYVSDGEMDSEPVETDDDKASTSNSDAGSMVMV